MSKQLEKEQVVSKVEEQECPKCIEIARSIHSPTCNWSVGTITTAHTLVAGAIYLTSSDKDVPLMTSKVDLAICLTCGNVKITIPEEKLSQFREDVENSN